MQLTRRTFIQTLAAASVAAGNGMADIRRSAPNIRFGICTDPAQAGKLQAVGFEFIEISVAGVLQPNLSNAAFAPELAKLKSCTLPIRSCNGFIPKEFRLTGPDATHEPALDYAVRACHRADALGVPFIVFGSGGARKVPEGFDRAAGKDQFIEFCQKFGDRIKDCQVTILLEPLNKGETNLLNSVTEGVEYVDAINRPHIQLLADFYHMLKEGEGPDAIRMAGARIRHCHIAELDGRKAPGTKGEDLSGFFKALKDIAYDGGVSCECAWPKENVEEAWKKALATLRMQVEV